MKTGLVLFLVLIIAPFAQADDPIIEPSQRTDAPFRLFRTQNIFNFIELDTRNGRVWQVQWSTDGKRQIVPIDVESRQFVKSSKPGRFTLYPTANIFTFLMLDQEDGRTWQVQWSLDPSKRFVIEMQDWFSLVGEEVLRKIAEEQDALKSSTAPVKPQSIPKPASSPSK